MAVHIRLARYGSKKSPFYRVVVTDQRDPRDGRFIENIGVFDPAGGEASLQLNRDRLDYWRARGARPSDTLERLLKKNLSSAAKVAGA
jgi:small subunit ribosomal protein S16